MEAPVLFRELIGESGQSRKDAVTAFAKLGVLVAPSTIVGYRHKRRPYDGNGAIARLGYSLFREEGDPTAKIQHYLNIGQTGVDLREPQKIRPHRLSSNGLVVGIAEKLGLTRIELDRHLRAIRVDICTSEAIEPDQRVKPMFSDAVDEYVKAYTKPVNSDLNDRVLTIYRRWRSSTIGNFYRILHQETSRAGISAWMPYELGFIRDYYQMLGEGQPRLSPFDRFSLEAMIDRETAEYAELLRTRMDIPIDFGVICSHVRVLTGSPTPRV